MANGNGSEPIAADALLGQIEEELREMQAPLQAHVEQIDRRLARLAAETNELQTLRRRISQAIRRVDLTAPAPKRPGRRPAIPNRTATLDAKVQAVRTWLLDHADTQIELRESITAATLHPLLRADGLRYGTSTLAAIVKTLHEDGDLVVSYVGSGGNPRYGLTVLQGRVSA